MMALRMSVLTSTMLKAAVSKNGCVKERFRESVVDTDTR